MPYIVTGWIKTSDKTPEDRANVITLSRDGYAVSFYWKEQFGWFHTYGKLIPLSGNSMPLYWMPLPEPPQE